MGQSPRGKAARGSGSGIRVDMIHVTGVELQLAVIVLADADEHAGRGALQTIRHHAGMFHRLPTHLQQQALLGIEAGRLPRRYPEKLGIKLVHAGQKRAMSDNHLSGGIGIRVVVRVHVPAIGRNLREGLPALPEHLPEEIRILRPARKSAPHPDDGNRRGVGGER